MFRLVANRLRWRKRAPIKTKQQARGDEVVTAVEVWHKSSEKGSIQKRSENVCEVTNASDSRMMSVVCTTFLRVFKLQCSSSLVVVRVVVKLVVGRGGGGVRRK